MTQTENERLLELLVKESGEAREDDRFMMSQFPVIIGAALTLIGGMAALYLTTCPAGYCKSEPNLKPIPIWMYVGAPMIPIVLISYGVLIATLGTLRSYYLRAIERRIHELTGQLADELPIPSWTHAQLDVTGQSRSGGWARLNLSLIYGVILLIVLVSVYIAFLKIPVIRYRIFALVLDGALMAIPFSASVVNIVGGARLWKQALKELPNRLLRTDEKFPSQARGGERSLGSYLLLPRNQEELVKALFIPICFLIATFLAPGLPCLNSEIAWHFVGFFLVFEFLVYQARYLLNDVRDRRVDCSEGLSKRRFPCSRKDDPKALRAALESFTARLVIAGLLIACVFPIENSQLFWHAGFLTCVFLIALPYEFARSKCNAPARVPSSGWTTAWTVLIIAVVGLGYGLRTVVGFWLAGVNDKVALLLAALGASLFGSMFVALTWALESTRTGTEGLAAGKAHLELFRRIVSRVASNSNIAVARTEKVLAGRQDWMAPWCVTAVLATGGLLALAIHLLRHHLSGIMVPVSLSGARVGVSQIVFIAAVGIAGAAVVTPVKTAICLTALNLVAVGAVLHHFSVPTVQSVVASILTTLPLIVTCIFRTMCFDNLPGFTDKLIEIVAAGMTSTYIWFTRER